MENQEEIRIISDASEHEISKQIFNISKAQYFTVFPVGFRAAGKTMFMSSIFRFADRHATKPFKVTPEPRYPFNNGFKQRDQMITNFDTQVLMGRTSDGSLDLFGMSLEPNHPKLDAINLNFVDVSGEDISKIKVAQDARLTPKLKAVFQALELDSSNVVFLLITPFESNEIHADIDEDTLQTNFVNFLKTDYPNLYKSSKLFVMVTKWDQNKDANYTVEKFIKDERPGLYSAIQGTNTIYGAYSIGKVLETTEGSITTASLVERNDEYPWRFWNKLYEIYTGKGLIYKTWWQRLFS